MAAPQQPPIIPYASDAPAGASPPPGPPDLRHFPSYTDYIDFLSQTLPPTRCFNWLFAFLTNYPDPHVPIVNRPPTRVLVADALDVGWRMGKLVNQQILSDVAGVKARIIVVECEVMSWIDRGIVDDLGLFYDLNPIYLWGVFSRNRVDFDYSMPQLFRLSPVPFDSADYDEAGISALELIHTNQRAEDQITFNLPSMSGIVLRNSQVPTALIFSKEKGGRGLESALAHHVSKNAVSAHKANANPPVSDLSWDIDVYEDLLLRSPKGWVDKMRQNPSEALFLYHNIVLRSFAQNVSFQRFFLIRPGEYPQSPEVAYLETNQFETSMALAHLETKRYAQKVGLTDSIEITKAMATFDRSLLILSKHKDHFEKHMQSQIGQYSLAESRKSIEMTDSVKVLTQLAFIFIPLTFSATIFGINVREFGTGDLPISAFIVTAIVVTASSMLLWWFGGKLLSKQAQRFVLFSLRLSLLSPRAAWIFLVFVVFGKHRPTNGKGLDGLSGLAWLELWVKEEFMFPSHREFSPRRFTKSEAWVKWLTPLADFVNKNGWKTDYAWLRWHRKISAALKKWKQKILDKRGAAPNAPASTGANASTLPNTSSPTAPSSKGGLKRVDSFFARMRTFGRKVR